MEEIRSSSGIGQETAVEFAKEGANLVIHGQNVDNLQYTENRIMSEATASKVVKVVGSMEDAETPAQILNQAIQSFGRLDVLVNNAGAVVKPGGTFDSIETLEFLFKVNFKSAAQLIELALPYLKQTKGNIVNVSSCSAIRPYPDLIYYGALKAALDHLSRTQAQIYGGMGVRVNTVNPGPVRTEIMNRHNIGGFEEWAQEQTSLHRIALVSEISPVILFLASEEAGYVNGANWLVDGGACCMVPNSRFG
uniref:Uncharacterized protein n=1 Tax=Ditylenchus dipsaci TaxID=166011 RepID=A0A915DY38_9BILA